MCYLVFRVKITRLYCIRRSLCISVLFLNRKLNNTCEWDIFVHTWICSALSLTCYLKITLIHKNIIQHWSRIIHVYSINILFFYKSSHFSPSNRTMFSHDYPLIIGSTINHELSGWRFFPRSKSHAVYLGRGLSSRISLTHLTDRRAPRKHQAGEISARYRMLTKQDQKIAVRSELAHKTYWRYTGGSESC